MVFSAVLSIAIGMYPERFPGEREDFWVESCEATASQDSVAGHEGRLMLPSATENWELGEYVSRYI